ncbi:CBS domain-containing protein [Flavobacterium sp. ASW18X]|uniref:CBS domain-containing protein n=1 Tax=Flavobacterium sp. ASW18X TaxID=2572595 RepID=UPI0010AE45F4|nr:CBS domain-containing protein [Flavobacterium sp. ASW18X]TKD66692.1 CBS domain-containing protein [Flavobacterium sp. ASW18X]
MHIQDKLNSTLPTFGITDTLNEVITFFEDTMYSHIAVMDNGVYLGMLSENDQDCFEEGKTIEDFRFQLETFQVTRETLWLDVLEVFSRNEANLVPVLDDAHRFVGYYDLNDVVDLFIGTPFFTEPGGILVVSKGIRDYSMSEIAQIVETNNGKLLGAFITESENDLVQVTLKIANANLNEVIQTFRRYSYNILFGNNDDQFLEDLKQRSDYLDKYLNV